MPCSPTIAKGVNKTVAIAKETVCWGEPPAAGTARLLRRVTANFNLTRENYASNENRQSYQVADMRLGTRSVTGSIEGELSPGSYSDLLEAVVARDFTAVTAITGLSVTIATSGSNYTITRSTGSWLTGGVGPGMVCRLTAGSFNAANLNKNFVVLSATATVLTVFVLNGLSLVAEGPIASSTLSVPGKQTFVPLTGHTDQSFTVEERYSDIAQYERYVGNRVSNFSVSMPATGMSTVSISMVGKDMDRAANTAYFTSPTGQSLTGILAASNGVIIIDGAVVAIITSADIAIERATENAVTSGSNSLAGIFTGKIATSGTLNMYFIDGVMREKFSSDTEVTLVFGMTETSSAASNAVVFTVPRAKLGSFEKADAENGITASSTFTALENSITTGGLVATSLLVQDTSL
jgi:hypothetical protein